jgi:hypothetical protein
MAGRLIEVHYSPGEGLTLRFRPRSLKLIPDATMGHLRTANKELLLALRSLLDQTIARMEEQEKPSRRPRKVEVKEGPPGKG